MKDLSVLIPARNEMFLSRTVEDILGNIEGNTEVIVAYDGYYPESPIKSDPRVTVIHRSESMGQRAATNMLAKLSEAKYIVKTDAHCAFDKGFDVKLMKDMQDDITMVPIMRNLHAFDWVCKNGHRRYQGPSGVCTECGEPTTMNVCWIAKTSPQSVAYRFDKTLHFQYFNEYCKRPEVKGKELTESLSLQGSFFMLTREKYWELNICDETWGSWGQQGVEVALKTWLSGGKVIVNHNTWYAHMFRTQGGDFGFPYPISSKQVEKAREISRDLFFNDKWPKAKYKLEWLLNKFAPVPDWHDAEGKLCPIS
jgi:glycosyltransferase involved in cell wall biosynthesis